MLLRLWYNPSGLGLGHQLTTRKRNIKLTLTNSLKPFCWAKRPFSKVLVNFAICWQVIYRSTCYLFSMLVENTKYISKIEKSPPTFSKTSYCNAGRNYNDIKKRLYSETYRKAAVKCFKVIRDSLGFCFPSCGFRIPGTQLWTSCQWNLDSQFQSLAGFRILLAEFPPI